MEHEIILRYMNHMNDLFSLYQGGFVLREGHPIYPKDRIAETYPAMTETELNILLDYLKPVEDYCEEVGIEIAEQCKCPFLPDDNMPEIAAAVKKCQQKYAWLPENTIKAVFSRVCWLSNR